MKYAIFRDDNDLKVEGILEMPDNVNVEDVQKLIYDIREKYCYEGDGFIEEKNVHWYDFMLDEINRQYGVVLHERTHDIYF